MKNNTQLLTIALIVLAGLLSISNTYGQGMSNQFTLATDANNIFLAGDDVKQNLIKNNWSISLPLTSGNTYIVRFSDSAKNNVRFTCNGVALEGNLTEMSITPSEDMLLHLTAHSKDTKSKFSYALLLAPANE